MPECAEVAVAVRRTPRAALRVALSFLNSPIALHTNARQVVVKPSIYDPRLPGNTELEMVRAVVGVFGGVSKTYIVESDNPLRTAEQAFRASLYDSLTRNDVELVNLSSAPTEEVELPGHYFGRRRMPKILQRRGFFVNVATLKTEPEISEIGAGMKNLFGLLPERDKSVYHGSIDPILIDLLSFYRPDLTVVDLTRPVFGERERGITKEVGGVVVGTDPVAIDAFCADLLGIDPLGVPHICLAHQLGLGEALLDRIKIRGTEHQRAVLLDHFR